MRGGGTATSLQEWQITGTTAPAINPGVKNKINFMVVKKRIQEVHLTKGLWNTTLKCHLLSLLGFQNTNAFMEIQLLPRKPHIGSFLNFNFILFDMTEKNWWEGEKEREKGLALQMGAGSLHQGGQYVVSYFKTLQRFQMCNGARMSDKTF